MNRKLLAHAFVFLLTFSTSSNAQQTFKPNEKEPGWTYNTIAELHDSAKKYLANLDKDIAIKKAASESPINPFHGKAKERYEELLNERKAFLNQTWQCPHKFWQMCSNCAGRGTEWWVFTCSSCNGRRGHNKDSHSKIDEVHSCSPATIRALLKVAG